MGKEDATELSTVVEVQDLAPAEETAKLIAKNKPPSQPKLCDRCHESVDDDAKNREPDFNLWHCYCLVLFMFSLFFPTTVFYQQIAPSPPPPSV